MSRFAIRKTSQVLLLTFGVCGSLAAFPLQANAEDGSFIEGFSQPFRVADVAAPISGIVEARLVSEGQRVKVGDALIKLDSSVHQALTEITKASMESKGELASAMAEHKLRLLRVEAIRELADNRHATSDELRRAETELELAEAHLRTVREKALLRTLEHQKLVAQARTYLIQAPFDGVVARLDKEIGEYVGPADPTVCRIVDLESLSVDCLIPRSHKDVVALNDEVTVSFAENRQRAVGRVYFISPYPDGETDTYTVKIRVDNSRGLFSAGERCHLISLPPAPPLPLSNGNVTSFGRDEWTDREQFP